MRGAMPNQQAVILLMGTVAQNVDIYKYRKTQVFRLIPHPHYRLEPDKIKRPEKPVRQFSKLLVSATHPSLLDVLR